MSFAGVFLGEVQLHLLSGFCQCFLGRLSKSLRTNWCRCGTPWLFVPTAGTRRRRSTRHCEIELKAEWWAMMSYWRNIPFDRMYMIQEIALSKTKNIYSDNAPINMTWWWKTTWKISSNTSRIGRIRKAFPELACWKSIHKQMTSSMLQVAKARKTDC